MRFFLVYCLFASESRVRYLGKMEEGKRRDRNRAIASPLRLDYEGKRNAVSTDCIIARATEYIARESATSVGMFRRKKKKYLFFVISGNLDKLAYNVTKWFVM